ncbi:MAG TPA: kynureninase, partial [Flavobacteriales bacterium]|nr:kynureninase [Flavobacteriales bacterium]
TELNDWAEHGVEGHFRAQHPWVSYHERFAQGLSHLVGAKANEVVAMNALTVNLHLLLVSFYRPSGKRTKILCEAKAFPSDQYALASQVRFHGGDPAVDIIEVAPREGSSVIEEADIEAILHDRGDEIALVMMGGVQYFTGQWLDMPRITAAAHAAGALCGFDLAHAVGNVPLDLHAWNVDFACWCTYKYLNSGPGAVAGAFVHERHVGDDAVPRFEGWWGHNAKRRFLMEPQFDSMGTAEAWQMSNAPVFNMAIHAIALEQFTAAGMAALRAKSLRLTAYLEAGIAAVAKHNGARLEVITPANPARRGCQLSLVAHGFGQELFQALTDAGVVVDWREPNVIRMAPVPMYNTFEDIARFVHILKSATQPH